jgi:RimJ/RimL family protein N-acetyltransferase
LPNSAFPNTQQHGWLFRQLLTNGFAIAGVDAGESYGSPNGCAVFTEFHSYLVKKYQLTPKACLLPQSRGGLMLINWASGHAESVQCIGGIYLLDPKGDDQSGRRMEIGYEISPVHRGRGYASEAIRAAALYGFKHMGLKRIQAAIMPENIGSIKACVNSGFKNEGTLRNYCPYQFRKELRTMVMMACIPSDLGIE